MKSMILVLALSVVSSSAAFADGNLVCKTAANKFHGFTSITVTGSDPYDAVIQGRVSGGMAHYIREITPVNVKITHEPDGTLYENSEQGVELLIMTSPINGRLVTSASFKEGNDFPPVEMKCDAE